MYWRLLPLITLFALSGAPSSFSCLNNYEPNTAAIDRSRSLMEQLRRHPVNEPWEARRDRLRAALARGGDYRVRNDLAVALLHTGEAQEAVALLEALEAQKPGLYMTATNLGTAYELAGNNEKALEWIRRDIALNPTAHEGTEWLHVRILETKVTLESDPRWLDSHSISWTGKARLPFRASGI